jgi:hypothetical protein
LGHSIFLSAAGGRNSAKVVVIFSTASLFLKAAWYFLAKRVRGIGKCAAVNPFGIHELQEMCQTRAGGWA